MSNTPENPEFGNTRHDYNPDDPLNPLNEPPVTDDDTADLTPQDITDSDIDLQRVNLDDDVPFNLPTMDDSDDAHTSDLRDERYGALTQPHFREPGVPDPKATLAGTGGLDPSPEMQQAQQRENPTFSQDTLQRIQTVRDSADDMRTVPTATDHERYQPQQPAQQQRRNPPPQQAQPAQGRYVPAPPGSGRRNTRSKPQRRRVSRILGFRPGCLYMMLGLMLTFCGGLTLSVLGSAAVFIPRIEAQWTEQIAAVDDYRAFESTFIYDRYGNELFEAFGEGRRETVSYDRFPDNLINATVAIEDDTFWQNIGVDVGATTVAAINFLGAESGERTPGGSTITQQVVRNILFDFEKRSAISVQRKAEEIVLAVALTSRKSKEDIMALYLNEIYYGNLAYGAQAAAQTLFGKDVQDLSIGEAALLAGLPQSPASLDPLNPDPEVQTRVEFRWRSVLQEMVEEGYISATERDETLRAGLNFVSPETSLRAPHFTVYAQSEFRRLMEDLGYSPDDIASGGYEVYTTIDQNINTLALGAARTQISNLQGQNVSNAAVVVQKPLTGEILAMVGSVDYNSDAIDGRVNVTTSLRQPGSTMKPFTYAATMENGMTAADIIWDTRTEIPIPGQPTYEPRNYDRQYHGPVTVRGALANSYNIPAVQALRLIGVEYLLNLMRRFGVTTLSDDAGRYGLSLTLGGGEVSLLELTNAYGVFANLGSYVESTSILCIVGEDDRIIYQYENGCPQGAGSYTSQTLDRGGFGQQVLDPRIAFTITDILSDNGARTPAMGPRSSLYTPNIGSAVKTGTTDDFKDNWTIGYTRNLVVGVWVGNNNGDPMINSSGLTGAAPIWNSVISSIYNGNLEPFRVGGQLLPDTHDAPGGMSLRQICDVRSLQDPANACTAQRSEWLLDGPAGIPDGSGGLSYSGPSGDLTGVNPQGSYLQEISPDIYRALVFPLPPQVANGIQFQLAPDQKNPPPPKYCRVTQQTASSASGAQELIFIAGPRNHNDSVEAQRYAQSRNIPFLPAIDCWQDAFTAGGNWGAPVTTAVISSPANGATLSGVTPILGTVQFDSSQADFFHLYIQGGPFQNWTPLGEEHYQPVINGQLDELYVPGLQAGQYRLRLILIKDGEYVQQPYEIAFNVQ